MTASPAPARGFTLVEMLMVITLLVIFASLAAPAMGKLVATQKVKSAASGLHLALTQARSEALKRNGTVSVTPRSGIDWNSGWIVGTAALVLNTTQAPAGVSVVATPAVTGITYRYDGRTTLGSTVAFAFSAPTTDTQRCVAIDPSGHPLVREGATC